MPYFCKKFLSEISKNTLMGLIWKNAGNTVMGLNFFMVAPYSFCINVQFHMVII